jgi:uncharacterized protein
MRIGVISDTHNFFDPAIPNLFAGVEHILHAGDIGLPRIILELEQIAPVTCVGGNTDDPGLGFSQAEVVQLAGRKFLVQHIVNPYHPGETLGPVLERVKPEVVVFGHTHKPFCQTLGGVLFFNPGYAGKTRFGLGRSLAILDCNKSGVETRFLRLD